MNNFGIPAVGKLAILTIALASGLSAAPFKCGLALRCDWIEDTPTRGAFIVLHPTALRATGDPLGGLPHSFVSPSGYWTVVFDSFQQTNAADGTLGLAEVDVKGYMQHLMHPPGDAHATDPVMGAKFPFDLTIFETINPEDDASGTENHGHDDTYQALLEGTDAVAPKTGFSSYNFGVKGRHTEVLLTPPTDTPEPSAFFLGAAVLLIPILRRRRLRDESSKARQ